MGIVRKIKRGPKSKGKPHCCGEQMTYKNGYGYVCEKCGKVKKAKWESVKNAAKK